MKYVYTHIIMSKISNIINVPVFIKTGINNGMLKTNNGMPQKDSTSDNQSSFSIDRRAYNDTRTLNPLINTIRPGNYGYNTSRSFPTVFDGTSTPKQKQWYGNRDASEITRKNRVNSVGLGTTNNGTNPISFESHANVNTINHALRRVRSGGAVAPPKKAHNTHNAYSPSPQNIPLITPLRIVNGVKMPPTKYSGLQNNNVNWQYKNKNTP